MIKFAEQSDIRQFFIWRNLPEAIDLSMSNKTVSWEAHCLWYNGVLRKENVLLFTINKRWGTVRCDKVDNNAVMSIYLIPEKRGKGIGRVAINQAKRKALKLWTIVQFIVYVKDDNEASLKMFRSCGFFATGNINGFIKLESF